MQLVKDLKKGAQNGTLYGDRRVEIISKNKRNPISIQGSIKTSPDNTVNITVNSLINNPNEFSKFLELKNKFQYEFNIVVHPHKEIVQGLNLAGIITSAYLLSFYRLGYRYILHELLNPVRNFIVKSFTQDIYSLYKELESESFKVIQYQEESFKEPTLRLAIPLDGIRSIHLQIDYLDLKIILPFHFVPEILKCKIRSMSSSDSGACRPLIPEHAVH